MDNAGNLFVLDAALKATIQRHGACMWHILTIHLDPMGARAFSHINHPGLNGRECPFRTCFLLVIVAALHRLQATCPDRCEPKPITIRVSPTSMPGFWKWMYYLSPFTYLISTVLSVSLPHTEAHCSNIELLSLLSTNGITSGTFMAPYISTRSGYLVDSQATGQCQYLPIGQTDVYLESLNIRYDDRWRNFGAL